MKFIAAAASHWLWCTDFNPLRTISAMNAVAMRHTLDRATVNIEVSSLSAWNAKNTSINVTRNGIRRKASVKTTTTQRNGASRGPVVRRVTASTKPRMKPSTQPTSESRNVESSACSRKMRL